MNDPILAIRHVAKRFGALQAVRDLSFEVRAGEIFGFLGPNGAGKTTTLRMIMGITAPDSGEVLTEGRAELDRSRIGYLPEERGLFEDTPVLETVAYLGALRGMRMADARAAALPLLERLGLAERVRDRVGALSKGNQQKVQLAGAILHRPALAVLDEPFSGLDPINQETFSALMRELKASGTAVLLSAHQLDLVERLADRFLLISRGHEVLSGTLEDMRRQAAGGRDEMVSVHLAPRPGGRLDRAALTQEVAGLIGGAPAEWHEATDHALRLETLLSRGTDLGPLLGRLAERAALLRVETRSLPLHEIYLRAVREGGETISEEEVTANA
jgi:ABC-2 type transport system ATP-binding protein